MYQKSDADEMPPVQLCPSSKNELGKGILPAELESELLAQGYIFACRVPATKVKTLLVCKRPIADAVTDAEMDDPRRWLAECRRPTNRTIEYTAGAVGYPTAPTCFRLAKQNRRYATS
jgi:hypothetical protein